jgi:hypothetical protein
LITVGWLIHPRNVKEHKTNNSFRRPMQAEFATTAKKAENGPAHCNWRM